MPFSAVTKRPSGNTARWRRIAAAEKIFDRRRPLSPESFQITLKRIAFEPQVARIHRIEQVIRPEDDVEILARDDEPGDLSRSIRLADPTFQHAGDVVMPHDTIAGIGHEDVVVGHGDRGNNRLLAKRLPGSEPSALRIVDLDGFSRMPT